MICELKGKPYRVRKGDWIMANIGVPGLILILIVALLLFGPNKLPELGRAFGKTLREFKKGAREVMSDDDLPTDSSSNKERTNNDKRLPE